MAVGLVRIVDRLTARAYSRLEEKIWREDLENSPHGQPWHTSFHASSFPGDDQVACGRKAIYGLMNVPKSSPISRFLRSVADSGKAIEDELVRRWANDGILLSNSADSEFQTNFADSDYWLSGNTDAAILPYRWTRPHIVEVKSKAHERVLQMKNFERGPDPKHVLQCKTYIGFAHEQHPWKQVWVDPNSWRIVSEDYPGAKLVNLEPCVDGTIFYVSRDDPSVTHEFTFVYDPNFLRQGREKLAQWQKAFIKESNVDRPRDEEGKLNGWSKGPCQYCELKKGVCKPDWEDGIMYLPGSHALDFAKSVWPTYDYNQARKAVLERWNES